MQFHALILALAAFNSVAMAAPKVAQPRSGVDEVEKRFPGTKASYDAKVAGQLQSRDLGKRCIYDAPDTCIQCNANCCKFKLGQPACNC